MLPAPIQGADAEPCVPPREKSCSEPPFCETRTSVEATSGADHETVVIPPGDGPGGTGFGEAAMVALPAGVVVREASEVGVWETAGGRDSCLEHAETSAAEHKSARHNLKLDLRRRRRHSIAPNRITHRMRVRPGTKQPGRFRAPGLRRRSTNCPGCFVSGPNCSPLQRQRLILLSISVGPWIFLD